MKKLHIQKSISWCEKHDISSVKLYSSSNIFLSNIYEDGTPISVLKNNNNAFLKNKSSNFTSNVYVGGGGSGSASGTYNKNKLNSSNELENIANSENSANSANSANSVNSVNSANETISSGILIIDTADTADIIETTNISNSE
jgi:hypothetical protein